MKLAATAEAAGSLRSPTAIVTMLRSLTARPYGANRRDC